MLGNNMKFSIITTVRNNLEMLKEALHNVSLQDGVEVEHVIVDGNSTDGTKEFLASLSNPKLKIKSEKDKSIYDALNKGLDMCSNEIIGILHSDDLFSDGKVLGEIQKLFLEGADVVYADLVYVHRNDTTKVIRNWKSGAFHKNELLFGWMPPHPTFFFRKNLLPSIGKFSLDYSISADYDYMLRFLTREDIKIGYLPRVITQMRVGGESNKSLKNILKKSRQDYEIAHKYFSSPLGTLIFKNLRKVVQFFNHARH